jgi:hypothetical protein
MLAPTLEDIETDFADARETCAQYRRRTAQPRKQRRLRRLFALS